MKRFRKTDEKRKSLMTVLLGVLLISNLFILVLTSFIWLPVMHRQLKASARDRIEEMVLQTVNHVESQMEGIINMMHTAGSMLELEDLSKEEQVQLLRNIRKSDPSILAIALFDMQGEPVLDTEGGIRLKAEEIRSMEWFQKALEGDGVITRFSQPHVQNVFSVHRSYVITLSEMVTYQQGGESHNGILLMDISYTSFANTINEITLNGNGYFYILDEQDELITHPRLLLLDNGLDTENMDAVIKQVVGTTHDYVDGRERLLFISTIGQTRWRLVGVTYFEDAMTMDRNLARSFAGILVFCGILSTMGAAVIVRAVLHPLRELEESVHAVTLNVDEAVPETGLREIHAVGVALNRLLKRIHELMEQIRSDQEKKRKLEFHALEAQINPHFLYNTLDSIIWMEEQGRSQDAITMVSALARLFRISISKGFAMITVAEEIEYVHNYVIIQKMRFEDRFVCSFNVEPEASKKLMPKLIVQPIVENAINHAIDPYGDEPLHIDLSVRMRDKDVVITVRDDGVGIPKEKLNDILKAESVSGGIGLKNVHERIILSFGTAYGLKITSEEDVGTQVEIQIPAVERENEML